MVLFANDLNGPGPFSESSAVPADSSLQTSNSHFLLQSHRAMRSYVVDFQESKNGLEIEFYDSDKNLVYSYTGK